VPAIESPALLTQKHDWIAKEALEKVPALDVGRVLIVENESSSASVAA